MVPKPAGAAGRKTSLREAGGAGGGTRDGEPRARTGASSWRPAKLPWRLRRLMSRPAAKSGDGARPRLWRRGLGRTRVAHAKNGSCKEGG